MKSVLRTPALDIERGLADLKILLLDLAIQRKAVGATIRLELFVKH